MMMGNKMSEDEKRQLKSKEIKNGFFHDFMMLPLQASSDIGTVVMSDYENQKISAPFRFKGEGVSQCRTKITSKYFR